MNLSARDFGRMVDRLPKCRHDGRQLQFAEGHALRPPAAALWD